MPPSVLNESVKTFLIDHIDSVAQLELLLLLRTSAPKCWTIEQLVGELRVDAEWARQRLEALSERGIVSRVGDPPESYCFQPANQQLAETLTAVAQQYLLHRVSMIEFIYSRPNDSIRAFSDAFRIRKEEPRG